MSSPTEEEQLLDIEHMITKGNHKSAKDKDNIDALKRNYAKEVEKGWMIPIMVSALTKLQFACVIPVGVHMQWTIDCHGTRNITRRVTHDCSFEPVSGHSINADTDNEQLDECRYGQCLRRVLHTIHRQRLDHPNTQIIIIKD